MADVKISQLPVATTPLDGTEVLPIVQSATTKQVSIANVTAGRAVSALSLSLTNALPVTSGGTGISTTGAGTFIVSGTANTISATLTPTLGVQQTSQGTLTLANTAAGAWPVTIQSSNSATAAWTMTLPPAPAAANGYILTSTTGGVTSWTNPTALGIDLDVGTTAITGGTTGRVLYDNAGVLGEYSVTGTGTTAVLSTSPTFTTGLTTPLAIGGTTASSSLTLQSTSGVGTSDSILFKVGNNGATTAATIDTAGNLGLGVTPSAWTLGRALQIGQSASFNGQAGVNAAYMNANAYYGSGGWTYINTDYATSYRQYNGTHSWATAASGTAGTAINGGNFAQAMTLDASGNLGIGTGSTSLTTRLNVGGAYPTGYNSSIAQIVGTSVAQFNQSGMVSISSNDAVGTDKGGSLCFGSYHSNISSPYPCAVISGRRESSTTNNYSGYFAVATVADNGTIAERMRINSNGNFVLAGGTTTANGIGITFPATQSASTDVNCLDDYEEGTWTPVDASGAGLTISVSGATYVKIGSMVWVAAYFFYPTTASSASALIGGLPFTASSVGNYPVMAMRSTNGLSTSPVAQVTPGGATVYFFGTTNGGAVANSSFSTAGVLFNGCYQAAS